VQDYPALIRSPVIKPSLRPGDWYISCFFVKAGQRCDGVLLRLELKRPLFHIAKEG